MATAGIAAGIVAQAVFHGLSSPWAMTLVVGATLLGAVPPPQWMRTDQVLIRMVLVGLVATALVIAANTEAIVGALTLFACSFGVTIMWGSTGRRLLTGIGIGAGIALLAWYACLQITAADLFTALPPWLVTIGASTAFSSVSILALLPRHVRLVRDDVTSAYAHLKGKLTGEARELVERAHMLWLEVNAEQGASDQETWEILRSGVLRLFEVARRWQAVEGLSPRATTSALQERITLLDDRIERTHDPVTRAQYQQAQIALAEQLRYLEGIQASRERVLARMHNYLAIMERLRLATINLKSTDAARESGDMQPLLSDFAQLGADMDACSDALVETDRAIARSEGSTTV